MSSTDAAKSIVVPSETIVRAQQASKTALSLALCYWLALWLNWDLPKYGALAIVLISLDTTGASLQKGLMRMIGTTVGLAVGLLGLALFAAGFLVRIFIIFHDCGHGSFFRKFLIVFRSSNIVSITLDFNFQVTICL